MPHAAIFLGAALAVGGAILLNELVVQPALQRRREEQEAQEEMDRAIALSLYEFDREENFRRQHEERHETTAHASSTWHAADGRSSSSTTLRAPATDPFSDFNAVLHEVDQLISSSSVSTNNEANASHLRRRRQFEVDSEMQERPNNLLFDAGPVSRLDTSSFLGSASVPALGATSFQNSQATPPVPHDTASLSEEELQDFLSPQASITSLAHHSSSALASHGESPVRAVSPTPTVRSATPTESLGTLVSRPHTPSGRSEIDVEYVVDVPSGEANPWSTRSSSPFSVIDEQVQEPSQPSSNHATFQPARSEASDSAWSDLGEDSSDEEVVVSDDSQSPFVRQQRQTYFGSISPAQAGAH